MSREDKAPPDGVEVPLPSPHLTRFARIMAPEVEALARLGAEYAAREKALAERPDDPALAVGLALHFARTNIWSGLPMPQNVLRLLERHVRAVPPASSCSNGLPGGW